MRKFLLPFSSPLMGAVFAASIFAAFVLSPSVAVSIFLLPYIAAGANQIYRFSNNNPVGNTEKGAIPESTIGDIAAENKEVPMGKATGNAIVDAMIEKLRTMGMKVSTDWSSAKEVVEKLPEKYNHLGGAEVCGFVHQGVVYINPDKTTEETPIHEYTHVWAEALRQNNKEEWENIKELMKQETQIWEALRVSYPHLTTDDEIADEVLATYSGRKGAQALKEANRYSDNLPGAFETLKKALGEFWRSVAKMFNFHYKTAEEIADRVLYDFLRGENPEKYIDKNKISLSDRVPLGSISSISEEKNNKSNSINQENMEDIIDKSYGRTDVFKAVTEVPVGYFVWAIGRHNFPYEKCVPLAKRGKAEFAWQEPVDLSSLKYIKVDSEETALMILAEASRRGCDRDKFYKIVNTAKQIADAKYLQVMDISERDLLRGITPNERESVLRRLEQYKTNEFYSIPFEFTDGKAHEADSNGKLVEEDSALILHYPKVSALSSEQIDNISGYANRKFGYDNGLEEIYDTALKFGVVETSRYELKECDLVGKDVNLNEYDTLHLPRWMRSPYVEELKKMGNPTGEYVFVLSGSEESFQSKYISLEDFVQLKNTKDVSSDISRSMFKKYFSDTPEIFNIRTPDGAIESYTRIHGGTHDDPALIFSLTDTDVFFFDSVKQSIENIDNPAGIDAYENRDGHFLVRTEDYEKAYEELAVHDEMARAEQYEESEDESSERYLSDADIAAQYSGVKIEGIKFYNQTQPHVYSGVVDLEFPNATHPDFDNTMVNPFICYDEREGRIAFDNWMPDPVAKHVSNAIRDEWKLQSVVFAVEERITSPNLKVFTDEQREKIERYLSDFDTTDKKLQALSPVWERVEQSSKVSSLPKAWKTDAKEELNDLVSGIVRNESNTLKR